MTDDASSTESTPVGRWRRWGTRSLEMTRGAGNLTVGWLRTLWRRRVTVLQKLESVATKLESAAAAKPSPPPPGRLTDRRETSEPIAVPARGYVFAFGVRATFTWSSQGLRPELLSWYAQYFMPQAIQRLTRLAADLARDLAPHQAGVLEVELQRLLAAQGPWRYDRGEVAVQCQPDAWVRLDERVRQALQPYWERSLKLQCQYDESMKRAQYVERLNRRWVTILKEFADSPAAEQATQATKEHLAGTVQHMMAEQKAAAQWSRDLLNERLRNPDVFEPFSSFDILPPGPPGQAHETPKRPGGQTSAGNGSESDAGLPAQS